VGGTLTELEGKRTIPVPVNTLDRLAYEREHPAPQFLKLDAQGVGGGGIAWGATFTARLNPELMI
jgi:hypothetical protein